MKVHVGEYQNNYVLTLSEVKKDQDEVDIFQSALQDLKAIRLRFQITSLDSFEEDYWVGNSIVKLESSNWDTSVATTDKDVVLAMKGIIEELDK